MNRGQIQVVQAGRQEYRECWELQQRLAAARRAGLVPNLLLLVEHPPTYTIGRRGTRDHLLINEAMLRSVGATCYEVDRGGDITFHGPGQLVVYSIIDLGLTQRSVRRYVENLETVVIESLRHYGLEATIDPEHPGVWLGRDKVAAIGISIHHGVSYHGFALNVDPDLRYFGYMIPCGIPDRGATSLTREIGRAVNMTEVTSLVVERFAEIFNVSTGTDLTIDDLKQFAGMQLISSSR
ncbi:MAG TPA: lipoyl(octanoyl) transferase LipB [Nitrolancea sp.]|nr:lipoyl(octanoyl) transferase LipB [Nitrolancea sp.]